MYEVAAARSAVGRPPHSTERFEIQDASALSMVLVRGVPNSRLAVQLSGVQLGHAAMRGSVLIGRLTSSEWVYVGSTDDVAHAVAELDLAGARSLVDVTHARTRLRLSGPGAIDCLQRWSTTDLSEELFPNRRVATAKVAGVRCEIVRDDQGPQVSYLIAFDRSVARWMVERLSESG